MDRRVFLAGVSVTGALSTTHIASARADADALVAHGLKMVPTMADLRALTPKSDEVVWLRGHHRPLDGGEGFFWWDEDSDEAEYGGINAAPLDASRGRWKRQHSPGSVSASWFESIPSLLKYCADNTPITVHLPNGQWNFAGMEIPTGISFTGVGLIWQGGTAHGGFKGGSVILGNPIQGLGPSANSFSGIIFDGGFTVRKQYTYFDNCAFIGGSLIFDQRDGAAPYYCTVNNCHFREISNGPCILFVAQANANRIVNSTIFVAQDQRGIVAEGHNGQYPTTNVITGCAIEAYGSATQIGSYVYGDFHNLVFLGNYLDPSRPIFKDGADIVFTANSRRNRIWLPNQYGDKFVYGGSGHLFHGATEGSLFIGSANYDLADLSNLPEMLIVGEAAEALTLPPIQNSYGKAVTVSCERDGGTIMRAAENESINGSASIRVENGEAFKLYTKYYPNNPVKNWIARKIW